VNLPGSRRILSSYPSAICSSPSSPQLASKPSLSASKEMLKRELTQTATNLVPLGPRNKKRKDEHASSDDVKMSDGTANGDIQDDGDLKEKMKKQGLELWHVIKDAVNKECVRA
jgi:hypothetical protein